MPDDTGQGSLIGGFRLNALLGHSTGAAASTNVVMYLHGACCVYAGTYCHRRQVPILRGAKVMHSHNAHTIFRLQHWSRFWADYVEVFGSSPPGSSTQNLALSKPDRLPTCHFRQRRSFPCL